MIKKITLSIMIVTLCLVSNAQTKVFKQISDDIEVRTKTIIQNGNVIGYFVFSQLEKTSKDSFSYQITLMDENLNDIGKKEFKHKKLYLYDIAFENDVFCIGYLKRDEKEQAIEEGKRVKKFQEKIIDHEVILQFMDLQGNFIKTITQKVNASGQENVTGTFGKKYFYDTKSYLKESLQINELEGKGFVVFYGDNDTKKLAMYTPKGDTIWTKNINVVETSIYAKNSKEEIFLIGFSEGYRQKFLKITQFDTKTGNQLYNYELKDKEDKPLYILSITQNPKTNKLAVLAKSMKDVYLVNSRKYINGNTKGLVTIEFNGNSRKDVKAIYSLWEEEKMDDISRKGKIESVNAYNTYDFAYKDFEGNSIFGGSGIKTSPKYGAIASSGAFAAMALATPGRIGLLSYTGLISLWGYTKVKNVDGYLMKQNSKGNLTLSNTIEIEHQSAKRAKYNYDLYNERGFGIVQNKSQKTTFIQVSNTKETKFFNTSNNKTIKTIPSKLNKQTSLAVFPAKEGHVMIVQVNSKEKTTTLSIESLN